MEGKSLNSDINRRSIWDHSKHLNLEWHYKFSTLYEVTALMKFYIINIQDRIHVLLWSIYPMLILNQLTDKTKYCFYTEIYICIYTSTLQVVPSYVKSAIGWFDVFNDVCAMMATLFYEMYLTEECLKWTAWMFYLCSDVHILYQTHS